MAQSFIATYNVKYGADSCQFVNLYMPYGTIAGTVLRVHGNLWSSGTTAPYPSLSELNDDISDLAGRGFMVVDINYRGINNSSGSNGNGQYPNANNDVITVLKYCLVSGAAVSEGWSTKWQDIYNTQSTNGGVMVSGTDAGAYLALYGVCEYGTSSGNWPVSVAVTGGLYNLYYPEVFIDTQIQNVINKFVTTMSSLQSASPYYQYGSATAPGPWFNAVNSSQCKFIFTHNTHDTLSTDAIALPTINNFKDNNQNTILKLYNIGPPQRAWPGTSSVTYKSGIANTSILASTTPKLGDAFFCIDTNTYWVYNQGSYPGDDVNPPSVNGYTRWFSHNFTINNL